MPALENSLLAHCVARSAAAVARADVDSGRRLATSNASRWDVFRAAGIATMQATRVASFVVAWALAVDTLGADATHAAIQRELCDSRATFYRKLAEFRELWGDTYDDPTPLAVALLEQVPAPRLPVVGHSIELAL